MIFHVMSAIWGACTNRKKGVGNMSVLIKGITRPKNCFECHLAKWIDDGCAGCVADSKIHNASKPVDCPLVEISEPHGALIDRDALRIVELDTLIMIRYKLAYAPTVIEAEGSEKE